MIIGNGMIANKLLKIDNNDILFFASGVSDSSCKDFNEYNREIELLKTILNTKKKLVYFSSINEYITNNYYLEHKLKIENIIKNSTKNFIILKLPQLIGDGGNNKNFIHFLYNNIKNDTSFTLYDTYRSLLDVDDMLNILEYLIKIDYAGFFNINYIELKSVKEFIEIIEKILDKKSLISNIIKININIQNNDFLLNNIINNMINRYNYNENTIKKYFN